MTIGTENLSLIVSVGRTFRIRFFVRSNFGRVSFEPSIMNAIPAKHIDYHYYQYTLDIVYILYKKGCETATEYKATKKLTGFHRGRPKSGAGVRILFLFIFLFLGRCIQFTELCL